MFDLGLLTGLGLDADTAQALAELIDEQTEAEAQRRAAELAEERMTALPRLVACTPGSSEPGAEAFARMDYSQRARLHEQDAGLYRRLAGRKV